MKSAIAKSICIKTPKSSIKNPIAHIINKIPTKKYIHLFIIVKKNYTVFNAKLS
jgi:hypothetical protein